MKALPLVSIILAVKNGNSFLRKAVLSILEGVSCSFEVIVVDDGSKDDSIESIQDLPVRLIYLAQSGGLAAARNTGFLHSRGQYVIFMDQDDLLISGSIDKRVMYLEKNPSVQAVRGKIGNLIDSRGEILEVSPADILCDLPPKRLTIDTLKYTHSTPGAIWLYLFRRDAILCNGTHDPDWEEVADCDFLFRFLIKFNVHTLNLSVSDYRFHGNNATLSGYDKKLISRSNTRAKGALLMLKYGISPF